MIVERRQGKTEKQWG